MAVKDNTVFWTATQFCGKNDLTPEAIIYGYAKLLLMNESQVRNLISDEKLPDLESARAWFANNKLDLKLIKSGLLLLLQAIPSNKKQQDFESYIETGNAATASSEILDMALKCAYIPMTDLFSEGKSTDAVFNYLDTLKAQKATKSTENTSASTSEAQNSDTENGQSEATDERTTSPDNKGEGEASNSTRAFSDLSEKYRALHSALLDVVKGQDHAVLKFIQGYNQGELLKITEKKKQPRSYFFFFGPPGVGKTLLAETAADTMKLPYKLFNMSEYAASQSHEQLIGISSMYNHATKGLLTGFVKENPESILVFDEIEKAHIGVIRLFLQILGSGKLRDAFMDEDIDFTKTTIIFTSNVGRELYEDRSVDLSTIPEKVLIDSIQREKNVNGNPALPPEICSRIAAGNTVVFNHLPIRYLIELVRQNFDKVVDGMEKEYGIRITYSDYLPALFLFNRGGDMDARVAVGQSGKFLKNEMFELVRQLENSNPENRNVTSIHLDVDWDGMDPELRRLFVNSDKTEILVLASDDNKVFEELNGEKHIIHTAKTLEEAREKIKQDIAVVYIDPFYGNSGNNETVLSIADYNTDGVRFFHEIAENNTSLPIFMLERGRTFSDVDRRTFLQEGAAGTAILRENQEESFKRQFTQTLDELYMEKESQAFSQRGWIIDYNTKQDVSAQNGQIKILFYGLKKRMAIDVESRGSLLSDAERPNVKFEDVVGAENAKTELEYFINYLRNPKKFLLNGGKPPKGILLYGPPGTGKTMLAKAMAGESDVAFLQTSASEFKNKWVGESEENIRKLFKRARKYAPAIIFIDEIDAIGKQRTGSDTNRSDESMLNALLTEMDGFASDTSSKPIFVLAATNFGVRGEKDGISSLDEALMRRFDNKIYVDLPKESERKEYIIRTLKRKKCDDIPEEIAQSIAERTTGQSLAVLQNVIDMAFREATRAERRMTGDDLLTALEDYIYGEKREHSPEYYQRVAIHETGHAFVTYLAGRKPSYITIESRADFGGYMQYENQEDTPSYNRNDLIGRIRSALAGRAAEQVFYGKDIANNSGAASDLENATNVAFALLATYGMEEGQLAVLSRKEIMASPLAAEYVAKVNAILIAEMKNTVKIIEDNRDKIRKIADVLAKENRLTGAQFESMMEEKTE